MKKRNKTKFANIIIVICVAMSMIICLATILTYILTKESIPASAVTAMTVPFTGELLLICLRQIFGSDIVTQAKTAPIKDEISSNIPSDSGFTSI